MKPYFGDYEIRRVAGTGTSRLLDQIPDKPNILYICGNGHLLDDPSLKFLCVIGSRKYSTYGYDCLKELISGLKGKPVAIISGLALGIDGIAHRAALDAGLPCIAVPGSGLHPDVLYPRSHGDLAAEILESGGLLLSEFEPDFRAAPWSFPVRNRIMAALSHAVLVVEGEEDSGTLITARLALDYNRDVLAIPGSIFSDTSKGPLSLIKRGAVPICSPKDLLDALGIQSPEEELMLFRDQDVLSEKYRQCSGEERGILDLLDEEKSRDELLEASKLPLGKLQIILSMLEIRGLIIEEFGRIKKSPRFSSHLAK